MNNRNIQSFLKLNGFYATEQEVVAIIRRLDVDADQKITYDEFIEAVRPVIVSGDEPSYGSSTGFSKSPSRFEEEKKTSFHHSPSRPTGSPLRESRGLGSSLLSVPGQSQYQPTSSPHRSATYKPTSSPSRFDEPRQTHSSPIRPRADVSRDLYSKSQTQHSPSRYQYTSPSKGTSLISSYGQQKRSSPLKADDEEELVRAFKEQISLEKELEDAKIRLVQ